MPPPPPERRPARSRATVVKLAGALGLAAAACVVLAYAILARRAAAHGAGADVAAALEADTAGTEYRFTVNTAVRHAISPYVYGMNAVAEAEIRPAAMAPWYGAMPPAEVTLDRFGGNRLSAYNWETNHSNAGNDFHFQNDAYLSGSAEPGAALRERAERTFRRNPEAAFVATVPMLGYVAADACECDVGTGDVQRAARLATHFRQSRAFKGAPLSPTPDPSDGVVYQDEFVHWVASRFPGRPIFYSLDNEPDIWHTTHKEVQSDVGDDKDEPRLQTYDGFIDTSIEYARAIKSVAPDAQVFGPATATWAGMATLGRWPKADPVHGKRFFLEVYLDRMREAEARYGRRLLDVLDVHWYPEVGTRAGTIANDYAEQDAFMVQARLQAPRSLWDPKYSESSWVRDAADGPIRLLPRLRELIAAHYPGTKLSVSEYYYGRPGDISGGIAQADVLGIFGREGVYAAAFWPIVNANAPGYGGNGVKAYAYVFGAYRMYLNYDGVGGRFGDTGVQATTSHPGQSSVYASLDARGRVVVVAINKTRHVRPAEIRIATPTTLKTARAFTLTADLPIPERGGMLPVQGNTLTYQMPALSVSTLVIEP